MSAPLLQLMRSLAGQPWRLLAVAASLALGTGVLGAIRLALASVPATLEAFYAEAAFADLEVSLQPDDLANLPDLSALPGVAATEARLVFPGILRKPDGELPALVVLSDRPDPRVNRFRYLAGGPFAQGTDGVVIDRTLRDFHGFDPGESIEYRVGEKSYRDSVVGVAVSPEFFAATANPDFQLPEKGSLGVVFGDLGRIREALGFTLVNSLVVRFVPGADPVAAREAVLEALAGAAIEKVVPRSEHPGHRALLSDMEQYAVYTWAITATLLLLAFLVAILSFSRLAQEQRREMGLLSALGFSPRRTALPFLSAGGLIGLVGGSGGLGVAVLGRDLFLGSYAQAMGLPFVDPAFDLATAALCIGTGLLLGAAASVLPTLALLRLPPLRLFHPAPSGARAGGPALGGPFRTILGPSLRYGMRNLLRRPALTGTCSAAIGFALAVPVSYSICTTSNGRSVFRGLDLERWDFAGDFLHPVFEDRLDSLVQAGAAAAVEPYFRRYVEAGSGGTFRGVRLLGLAAGSPYRPVEAVEGEGLTGRRGDAVLSRDVAKSLGLGVGDTVLLRAQGQAQPFRVAGITSDFSVGQAIVDYRDAQAAAGYPGKATGAYFRASAEQAQGLLAIPFMGRLTDKGRLASGFARLWEESMGVVYVAAGFSILMAAIFATLTVGLGILERRGEYALLRSLGFGARRVAGIISSETAALVAASMVLSLPFAVALALYLNHRVSEIWFEIGFHHRVSDYAVPILLCLSFVPLTVWLGARQALRIDLAREMRGRIIQ